MRTQVKNLLGGLLFPQPSPQSNILAEYYTWFASSASFGLLTVIVAALLASQPETSTVSGLSVRQKVAAYTSSKPSAVAVSVAEHAPVMPKQLPQHLAGLAHVKPYPKPVYVPRPAKEMLSVEITSGDTMLEVLTEQGVSRNQAQDAVAAIRKVYNPRQIKVGQELKLQLQHKEAESALLQLSMRVNPLETVKLQKSAGRFLAEKIAIETQRKLMRSGGTIRGSFYQTAANAGLSPQMIQELITAFSYDVDFQRDIKAGQQMDVLFEHLVDNDGKTVKRGALKYAALDLGRRKVELYYYRDHYGRMGFFHPNGESVRKSMLKTPVNGARISSGFGMRRHPILGYSKMHKGMDFAAPTGTPVYAAGDGIVQRASYYGAYGNYLQIKHNGTYASAYGHLSRFAPGVRPGSRVRQGQVVAYVGTTGRSTGPHLHYEILKYGTQINPSIAKFHAGNVLEGRDLAAFRSQVQQLRTQMASMPRSKMQLAMVR
jgi:murein DD-endopeptidase MepM/ murein hydrolase activator NlpD